MGRQTAIFASRSLMALTRRSSLTLGRKVRPGSMASLGLQGGLGYWRSAAAGVGVEMTISAAETGTSSESRS